VSSLPLSVDVVVVGGGLAGLASARALAGVGASVLVLEREAACGQHASGRSVGMGRQLTDDDLTTTLAVRGASALRVMAAAPGRAALWRQHGSLLTFDRADGAAAYAARAARVGVVAEPIGPAELRARWPQVDGGAVAAGLWIASDGLIDLPALVAALVDDVTAAAGVVACGCDVTDVQVAGDGATVHTGRGVVRASAVVDAAGAWAGTLAAAWGARDPGLVPRRRHVFALPAPAMAPSGPFWWHLGQAEIYLRPAPGEILTSACDAEEVPPHDPAPVPGADVAARARLAQHGVAAGAFTRTWACLRTFGPGAGPVVGRDPDRPWLWWAAALGGHGATTALAIGADLAAALAPTLHPR
jgi:D-arginine dehydrogenase